MSRLAQALRLDRSASWIVQQCLKSSLADLASLKPSSAEVTAMKVSPLRDPLRLAFLSFNLALADSKDPAVQELAPAPKGEVKWTFTMPRAMYKFFNKQGDRLKLAADEIFMWAWKRSIDSIRSMEENARPGKF